MSFSLYIFTALALVFVIEGLLYAIFPDAVRRMFAMALEMPINNMRQMGLFMALLGFIFIWILQSFANG